MSRWRQTCLQGLIDKVKQNTHQQVKSKILERMAEWTEMFSREPDLGIMEQAFSRLKSQSMQNTERVLRKKVH